MKSHALTAFSLASLLIVPLPVAASATQEREWHFQVLLDENPIGWHTFALSGGPETQRVRSEARFRVKLLGLTIYDYDHHSHELWRQDCVQRIDASTDDNGSEYKVHGSHSGEQLLLDNGTGETALPGCVMTFAYWNPAILDRKRLLNVQTGEYLEVEVQRLGEQTLELNGLEVPAVHYRIDTGERDIELWYSNDYDWLGLRSTTRGGRELYYRRVTGAAQARSARYE